MTVGRLGSISVDCTDPPRLGKFWAAVTGGEIAMSTDTFVAVKLPAGPWLSFVRDEDHVPMAWPDDLAPKRFHLDIAVTDLDEAERAAVALGARLSPTQPAPEKWRVLIDPDGHPFCVSIQIPD